MTDIFYQAHRGSTEEAPENTLAAFRHAWRFPGAVPETDVRTTRDGVLICLHDATLARTTNAPAGLREQPVAELSWAEVQQWEARNGFGAEFADQGVPALNDLLAEMVRSDERKLYLELKDVRLERLRSVVDDYGIAERLLFVAASPQVLMAAQTHFPGAPTMAWLGGNAAQIQQNFERLAQTNFAGISHLQLHLRVQTLKPVLTWELDDQFLSYAAERLRQVGAVLQLRPFALEATAMAHLLALGVRWYVTDAPEQFSKLLATAVAQK